MSFFDSNLVKNELDEIEKLQDQIFDQFCRFKSLTDEEQKSYIENLEMLLNKQKIFYSRLALSDDPEAINKKNKIKNVLNEDNIMYVFENLEHLIAELKNSI